MFTLELSNICQEKRFSTKTTFRQEAASNSTDTEPLPCFPGDGICHMEVDLRSRARNRGFSAPENIRNSLIGQPNVYYASCCYVQNKMAWGLIAVHMSVLEKQSFLSH